MSCHVDKSNPGHTRLDQQITKYTQTTFGSPFRNAVEKRKRKTIAKVFALHTNLVILKILIIFK